MSKLPSLHFDGKVLDVSANPYVNIDVRGNDPFMLSVIAVDNNNQRKEYKARVVKTDQFHTVSFNLASLTGIDLSAIQRFYLGFNRAGFAFRSTVWFDRISIGEGAANLATIDAIPDKKYYKDSGEQEITLTHIKDASSVSLAGSPALIENISISPITNGTAKLGFTLKPGAIGQETITLTANGSGGYQDNTTSFDLTIEGNNPPTLGSIGHLQLEAKAKARVTLTGISDGNATIEQPLSFKVLSSDPKVAKGNVEYSGEGPEATLHVSGLKKGKATLTVQVKDNGDGTSSVNVPFEVEVFNNLNGAPTIDQPGNLEVYQDAGPITITLTGIDHGGRKKERLNITATHSNAEVLTDLQVEYEQGSETASLTFTPIPAATGTSTVNVVLSDDGGNGSNNGNQSTTVQFDVTVLQRPVTGYIASLDKETEGFSSNDKYTITEVDSAGFKALIFQATDKFYWDGVMMNLPQELDLSENPYLTMEVYPVSQNTLHWIWFYDVTGARNELNNLSGDHIQQAIAGQWNKLVFDFSGENDWVNNGTNAPINNKRINRILFDMHNAYFSWPPPPNYTGTFIIRNLRVGSAADFQKVATTTIHPVADQVLFTNQESQSITLSGISDGNGSHAGVSVSVENSNSSAVVNPIVSDVNDEGIATLSFATGLTPGESTVTITVSAEGATSSSMSFKVQTLHADAASAANVTIDPSKRFQRMYGFGSFSIDEANIDFYTKEMGGTAMRVGIISNQFEPVNDNDDPHVLNLEGFNYSAFNWDALKELKAKGVQNFILTSWSPPAWMKTNLSVDYFQAGYTKDTDGTDNRLDYTMYEEFAESMVAIVKAFQQRAGIDLLAIGLQNEPAFHEPYPSAILGPDKFVELIKVVGRRFRAEGIDTRLYMAEQVSMFVDDNNLYLNTLQADAEANSYCDIFALHGYGSDGITPGQPNFSEWQNYRANAAEGDHPKDVWMTETHKDYNSFVDALQIAGAIYGALEHGDVSLWTQWGFEGPFVQQGKPTGMLYTMSNFSRFIKPGDVRVESVSAHEDVLVTTFINEESNEYASVLINKGNAPLSVNLQGIDLSGDVAVFNTAENRNLQAHPQLTDGVLLLPAKSVTTLTNKSFATESQQTLQDRSATARSNEGQRFNVYPNPSNGFFYLETDEQVDEVDIVDLYGVSKRKVKLQAGEMTVPVAGLRPGIYILNMKSKEGSRKQRIVIE
jgi:O-glycosyl hydrolase